MSRVIKFRAWDKEEKVMLRWPDEHDAILDAIPIDSGDEWTERCIVEQFTGLLDSKGREIWEGDIVTWGCHLQPDKADREPILSRLVGAVEFGLIRIGDFSEPVVGWAVNRGGLESLAYLMDYYDSSACQDGDGNIITMHPVTVEGNVHQHTHLLAP